MNLVEYTPDRFPALRKAASQIEQNFSLRHKPFVDYYYATRDGCRLYMFLSPEGDVRGLIGVERMPFEFDSQALTLGFGSNFHALQHGVGGLLFLQWVRSCGLALEYGGTEAAHQIISQQKWTYFAGIRLYALNHDYPVRRGEGGHRRVAKWALRRVTRRTIPAYRRRASGALYSQVSIREESDFADGLLPLASPFRFRLAPTLAYLRWRYNLQLPFVRYRLFRILHGGRSAGYVILNEGRERLLVAQCDANHPQTLACGVVLSILEAGKHDARPRTALLACAHPAMAEIYTKFGFTRSRSDYPVAIGGLRQQKVEIPADTTNWLVNFDWGDNGLLGPFPGQDDECPAGPARR